MLGVFLFLIVLTVGTVLVLQRLHRRYKFVKLRFLYWLLFYHVLLSIAYFVYVIYSPSDSKAYYNKVVNNFRGETWGDFYGTSTTFIEFLGYPLIHYLSFSYESMMVLFSFVGYFGFVCFYLLFRETIRFNHRLYNIDLITIIFFLPNLHFWSSSYGKGSVIFLGIGMFFFGIQKPIRRWLAVLVGAIIVYHVRPHIMLVILVSTAVGFLFSSRGISWSTKSVLLAASVVAFFFIYRDVLTLVGIDEEEFITQGLDLTHRAEELSKATSGIDITNYSLPMQVFTFLFRPLFFDAPGLLGVVVSFENVFYILFTLNLFRLSGVKFILKGNFLVKSAFLSFITVSIALAQISGNLGLAIRQKSQVMILFLFVILMFLDEQKYQQWVAYAKKKAGRKQAEKVAAAS